MSHRLTSVALFAVAFYAASAHADNQNSGIFSFSGFGSAGLVHSSEKQADFASSLFKPNGAGYSHNWSADVNSLLGAQVTAQFTPRLSAVLQVISEQNYNNSYRPHVEWANVQYQFTSDFSVRVGRTVLPTFLFSGSRKVAYTYPWVRPPRAVYRLVPVTASDGLDVSYHLHVGDFTHTIQANYGRAQQSLPHGGVANANRAWGITYTAEYHAATLHLAYQRPHLTIDSIQPLFDAFRQFGPEGVALADKYGRNGQPLAITAIGVSYDPGQWFATAEWGRAKSRSFLGDSSGWYVSGGYRFGRFTPYLTYARARADNLSDPGLNLSTLPPFLVGSATGLNAALNSLLRRKNVQNTLSVGGRWEVARNVAFKLQYDYTRIGAGSTGGLINLQPGFRTGGRANVISAKFDFVF